MYKLILAAIITTLFLGCGNSPDSSSETKYLTVAMAPVSDVVSIFQTISLVFSDDLNLFTVTNSSAYIKDTDGNHVGLYLGIGNPDNTIVFTPYQYFKPSSTYTLVITTDIQNTIGQSLSTAYSYTFTTQADAVDTTPITLKDINPLPSATADISTKIYLEFSKFISPDAQYEGSNILSVTCGGNAISGEVEFFNAVVSFTPTTPLPLDSNCTTNLVGTITDMYGNSYSGTSSWSFTTNATEIGNGTYFPITGNSVKAGTAGYLLSYYPIGGGDVNMIALAKDGGIDFYDVSNGTFIKQPFSLQIASKVTEMVFVDDNANFNDTLLISTMNDGIYKVQTDGNSSTVSKYLENETAIYGIGYGKDGSGLVDRVYAVGPQMGMKIFTVDGNGVMTFDKTVLISGEPLKVIGYTYSLAALIRKTYVSDYTNGVMVFDENGTFESLIDINGTIKHIASANDGGGSTGTDYMYILNSVGNLYSVDAVNPSTLLFEVSTLSNTNDINTNGLDIYISMPKDGFLIYDTQFDSMILLKSSGNIVSSVNAGGWMITLDSDGTLNIYGLS